MNSEQETLDYVEAMKKWLGKYRKDRNSSGPEPALPRFLALDFKFTNGAIHNALITASKTGYFESVRVLSFHEKHGTRHFLIMNQEDFGKAALQIVKERKDWYGYLYKEEEPIPPKPSLEEAISSGFDCEVCHKIEKLWNEYKTRMKEFKDAKMQLGLLKAALSGDDVSAVRFLVSRKNYEYEGWELMIPEIPK